MPILLSFLILLQSSPWENSRRVHYPVIQKSGNTIQSFVPHGWKILDRVNGDLNQDGVSDAAVVLESLDTTLDTTINHEWTTENGKRIVTSSDTSLSRLRILIILLRMPDSTYRCDVQADSIILVPENEDQRSISIGDPFWSPDDRPLSIHHGVLNVHMEQREGSSYWKRTYRFRHQQDDWYLIGADAGNGFGGSPDLKEYDVNLLTGDVRIGTATMDQPKETFKNVRLSTIPKYKLKDFRPFALNVFDEEGI